MKPTTTAANYQREYLDLQQLPHPAVTPVMQDFRGMHFFDPDLLDAVAETYNKSFATAAPSSDAQGKTRACGSPFGRTSFHQSRAALGGTSRAGEELRGKRRRSRCRRSSD
jgi:hypothetical protein